MKKTNLILLILVLLMLGTTLINALEITVGTGDQQNRKPFDFFYRFSLYETLYYPDEMTVSGYIDAITFYNNFPNSSYNNGHIQIWLGMTSLPDLSAGWIPSGQLTSVFNHYIDFPNGQNAITLNLQTPFLYTGGNLVMMARSPGTATWPVNPLHFYCQTRGATRARDYFSNDANADHAIPPMTGINLTLSGQFPKTTFHFLDTLNSYDLGIVSFAGPENLTLGTQYTHTVGIHNYGMGFASQYTVKLYGRNDEELANVTGVTVLSGEDVQVPITWTPSGEEGYATLYTKVFLNEDENQFNDTSTELNVIYLPVGGGDFDELGTLCGKVSNSLDQAIAGANVQISAINSASTTSSTGFYCFDWLQPGVYEVTVSAPGYVNQTKSVTVLSAQDNYLDFKLHNVADLTISGRVVRSADQASGIPNATVEIVGVITTAVATDADGYFRIYDVQANQSYLLRAMHPDYFGYYGDITLTNQDIDVGNLALSWDNTPADNQVVPPAQTVLHSSYPNPFRNSTTISYELKKAGTASLEIYNILGQKIRTLFTGPAKAGTYNLTWNSADRTGKSVANGIYFCKLTAGHFTSTRKLVVLK